MKICIALAALWIVPTTFFSQDAPRQNLSHKKANSVKGVIQISSVRSNPRTLNCSVGTSKATITVQAYFVPRDKGTDEPTAVLEVYGYSTDPPGNPFALAERRERVQLRQSPAVAKFEVGCSAQLSRNANADRPALSLSGVLSGANPGLADQDVAGTGLLSVTAPG
jgi:hypothetical protein